MPDSRTSTRRNSGSSRRALVAQSQCLKEWWTPFTIVDFRNTKSLNQDLSELILRMEKRFLYDGSAPKPFPQQFGEFSQLWERQDVLSWKSKAVQQFRLLLDEGAHIFWDLAAPKARQFKPTRYVVWCNVSRKSDWHGVHSHWTGGTETISGVYWVQIPKRRVTTNQVDAHTIYFDPRGSFHPTRQKKIMEPVEGRMLLHPSWLSHCVAPVRTDDTRISIGFDIHCGGPI
jgi:uncharacterized protein (TIGR02466 family)